MSNPEAEYVVTDSMNAEEAMIRLREFVAKRPSYPDDAVMMHADHSDMIRMGHLRALAARPEVDALDVGVAADAFRKTLVPRADHMHAGQFPMWYGWALYDAFVAGAKWQRSPQKPTVLATEKGLTPVGECIAALEEMIMALNETDDYPAQEKALARARAALTSFAINNEA